MSTFDLDAAVAATPAEPFRFTWGGKEFALARVLDMAIDRQLAIIEKIERFGDGASAAQLLDLMDLIFGADLLAELSAVKPLSANALMTLLDAWVTAQGADLGKSPASSPSSASTGKPSKQTSRSGRGRKTS